MISRHGRAHALARVGLRPLRQVAAEPHRQLALDAHVDEVGLGDPGRRAMHARGEDHAAAGMIDAHQLLHDLGGDGDLAPGDRARAAAATARTAPPAPHRPRRSSWARWPRAGSGSGRGRGGPRRGSERLLRLRTWAPPVRVSWPSGVGRFPDRLSRGRSSAMIGVNIAGKSAGQSSLRRRTHVRDHHRRQPAEAGLAGRAQQAVGAVAAGGRRAGAGQGRRHPARHQGAGGRRHRHRRRRRAGAPALRARLPGARRGHRLRPQGGDGHPRRPL